MDLAALPNSYDNTSYVEGPNDGKHIQLGHDLESMQGNGIQIDMKAAEEEGEMCMMTIWNQACSGSDLEISSLIFLELLFFQNSCLTCQKINLMFELQNIQLGV